MSHLTVPNQIQFLSSIKLDEKMVVYDELDRIGQETVVPVSRYFLSGNRLEAGTSKMNVTFKLFAFTELSKVLL
jgi:hypothetical protein